VEGRHAENWRIVSLAFRWLEKTRDRYRSRGTSVAQEPPVCNTHLETQGIHMASMQQALDDVLRRVQGEYNEMPGLRLTTAQAQRLWGLDRAACDALLGALVDAKFLFRTRDGAFVRSDLSRATISERLTSRPVGASPAYEP
jgi:hypothetical protein